MVSASQYEEVADKDDLMGVEDTAKKGILPAGPAGGGDVVEIFVVLLVKVAVEMMLVKMLLAP